MIGHLLRLRPRRRSRLLVALVTAGCAASMLVSVIPASAASVPSDIALSGVSCAGEQACVAVGAGRLHSHTRPVAEVLSDGRWRITHVPASPYRALPYVRLVSVSCPAADECQAVGVAGNDSTEASSFVAYRWNGHRWHTAPTPHYPSHDALVPTDVSCTGPSSCFAVSLEFDTRGGAFHSTAQRWQGHRWISSALPAVSRTTTQQITSVSCVGGSCLAVGTTSHQAAGYLETTGVAYRWTGSRWVTDDPHLGSGAVLRTAACVSASLCRALGVRDADKGTARVPLARIERRGRWRGATVTVPDRRGFALPESVSCAATSRCVAVGQWSSPQGPTTRADSYVFTGSRWTERLAVSPTANSDLSAVSCPADGRACIAVGGASSSSGATTALVERWNGHHWHVLQTAY